MALDEKTRLVVSREETETTISQSQDAASNNNVKLRVFTAAAVAVTVSSLLLVHTTGMTAADVLTTLHVKIDPNYTYGYWEDVDRIIAVEREIDDALSVYESFTCDYNDDDWIYLSHEYCSGDELQCEDYTEYAAEGKRGGIEAIDQCGFACEGEYANFTWLVPCMWDTIAHMDEYCSDKNDDLSSGYNVTDDVIHQTSRNRGVNQTYFSLNMSKTAVDQVFTGCNLHAFCIMCVDDEGTVNPYCKAYVERYNSLDVSGWYHFFQQEHNYWCTDDILTRIADNEELPCDVHSGLCDDDELISSGLPLKEKRKHEASVESSVP